MRISRVSSQTNRISALRRFWRIAVLGLTALAVVSPVSAIPGSWAADGTSSDLRWRSPIIRIAVSPSLLKDSPNIKHDSDVAGAIERSVESWMRVANVDLRQVVTDKLSVSPVGAAGDGVNLVTVAQTPENVLLFSKDPEGAAATTRVFYNRRGWITEADIVLNPFQQFSTDGTFGTYDLESTLTHEIGHLLGLSHSEILGATMHANYGKNGVFGAQRLTSRTLSTADIRAVRALYGPGSGDSECCGSIEGKLALPGKPNRSIEVWIEDSSGRVHGNVKVSQAGDFFFPGLTQGKYRLFAHEPGRSRNAISAQEIGTAGVWREGTASITPKVSLGLPQSDFGVEFIGANAQLAEMAVSVVPGRTYTLYLGGRNLDPKDLSILFSSPNITAVPGSVRSMDYGPELSVVMFQVRISRRAEVGEYSINVETKSGDRRALVGAISVDNSTFGTPAYLSFDD